MGVDIGKMQQRQKEEDAKAAARAAGGFKFWSPKVGDNLVRFMPPWTEEGPNANDFAREIYVHWNVGPEDKGVTMTCPVKTPHIDGRDCPVCAFVKQLRATEDAADAEMASDISAKSRFYSNVVDLNDEIYVQKDVDEWKGNEDCPFTADESKIQVFSYGPMIYKELLDIFVDGLDITDADSGFDVKINRTGKGKQDTKYRVRVDSAKGQSPFNFHGSKTLEESVVNLDVLMPPKSFEDMNHALGGTTQAALPPPSTPAPTPTPTPAPSAPVPTPTVQSLPMATPVMKSAVQVLVEEEPDCFKNTEVFSETDPECVGGPNADGAVFDKCPVYAACKAHCKPKPKRRSRRKKEPKASSPADNLEAEMKAALKD